MPMDVHNYCSGCLCSDRDLLSIDGTNLFAVYLLILKEIPQYTSSTDIRLCFECRARVRNFKKFKFQATRSYTELYYTRGTIGNSKPQAVAEFRLQTHIDCFTYDCGADAAAPGDQLLLKQEKVDIELDTIKYEECYLSDTHAGHYSEPETFTKQLDIIQPTVAKKKRKRKKEKKIKKFKDIVIESDEELNLKQLKEKNLNEQNEVQYDCKQCSLIFSNEKELIAHSKGHDKRSHICDICKLPFRSKTALKQHITEHSKSKPEPPEETQLHACDLCTDTFTSADKVQLHRIRAHQQRPECADCGKLFSSRKTYSYHIKVIHKGHNRFPCPQCGKVYQWKSNLWRHLKNHKARDSGELHCAPCDRSFSSVATYQHHMRLSKSHVTDHAYSYVCSECGKKFVNKTRLKDHENWEHLKQVNYRCHKCDKPFKSSTSLYVHVHNVHKNKDEKDNLCHVCGKSYQNIAKLKYHIVAMHSTAQPYACAVCSATFSWYSSLYRHTRDLHHKMKIKKLKKEKKESDCGE